MNLEEMAMAANALANEAMSTESLPCTNVKGEGDAARSCLMQEEDRPLTRAEEDKGWARRPYFAYDENRMCNGCCSAWHLTRAGQILHEMNCWRIRIEAEQKRKAASNDA